MSKDSITPKIAVIGGGTGSFTILNTLKHYTSDITALVNMADDGGSTGELRDELGVLPPGDIRQCLVALSPSDKLRAVFNHRFPSGTLEGHSLGNLLLSGIESMANDFEDAIAVASDVLRITGRVVPMTLDNRRLIVTPAGGHPIHGEATLEATDVPSLKGAVVGFDGDARINPRAAEAIEHADMVVIAPGDLYTSIAPALAVQGVGEALRSTHARIVYVCNLVNKDRHTVDFTVEDYLAELERLIGAPAIDYVLFNTQQPSPDTLARYIADRELPVGYDEPSLAQQSYSAIGGAFLSHHQAERSAHDKIQDRSLIRHDGVAVAKALMRIYFS